MGEVETGLLQSAIFVGISVGTAIGGVGADRFGRRPCVLAAYFGILVSGVLLSAALGYYTMLCGCVLFGMAMGVGVPSVNALIVESTPANHRGDMMAAGNILWFFGELYGATCVWIYKEADPPPLLSTSLQANPSTDRIPWRGCVLLGLFPVLPLFIAACFLLWESPRYLASRGKRSETAHLLAEIARANGKVPDEEFQAIQRDSPELGER